MGVILGLGGGLGRRGGGGGERSREMLRCSGPSVSLAFPSGGRDVLKSPTGEMKGTQGQQAQTVSFLGDTALLFPYCRIVLAIFI